jgi:hypothetical protein
MFNIFLRAVRAVGSAYTTRYRRTPLEAMLAARFRRPPDTPDPQATAPLLLAMEAPPDSVYYAMLGQIVLSLRRHYAITVEQVATQALSPGSSLSFGAFLQAHIHSNFLWRRKWERLYAEYCNRIGYRTTSLHAPWREAVYWWEAWRTWRTLGGKDDLAALMYRGVPIGDAVIDSYLRLRPSVSVDLRQRYLLAVIRRAYKDVASAQSYFRRVKPDIYLTFYATYIDHAVPARVATLLGIRTLCLGNLQDFFNELAPDHMHQVRRVDNYRTEFDALPNRAAKLEKADVAFRKRTSGGTDAATAYMRNSAYAVKTVDVPDVRGAAVVFLHDFYDSVHLYRWSVFHDFWEWACATIEQLQTSGNPFFIKPHPNQRAESNKELAALRARYPHANFISPDISNRQLAEAGMACAVTVFGTIAAEMAYMGIPSISCGDNPHVGFDALHLARSKAEYQRLLMDFPKLESRPEILKEQACAFYYMHNLNLSPADSEIRDKFASTFFYLSDLYGATSLDPVKVDDTLNALTAEPGFSRFVQVFSPVVAG